jgi:hypothetical protein
LLVYGSENCRLEMNSVTHRDHDFPKLEKRLRVLGETFLRGGNAKQNNEDKKRVAEAHVSPFGCEMTEGRSISISIGGGNA